jgi:peptidoglycan/LPS O-acetylase OafA/YrhL
MYLLLPPVYLIAKKWRSPLPLAFLWIAAVIAGWGSHYVEELGFPDWFIFAPCFMAGALAYKASSLPRLNLPTALWPVALAFITLFYLRHDTLARSWWSCLALGLLLPQFREISTPVFQRVFKYIARYSYSVYLTHFFFIWLAFDQLHNHSLWLRWFVFLFSTITASALSLCGRAHDFPGPPPQQPASGTSPRARSRSGELNLHFHPRRLRFCRDRLLRWSANNHFCPHPISTNPPFPDP